jgi:hypothetical protein
MSGPPPNYDPNASMLHGGTNSVIQPVMGGGGMPSPNYNIENSLLAGGTGTIEKVFGGGAKTTGNLQGEVYTVRDTDIAEKYRKDYFANIFGLYDRKKDETINYFDVFKNERMNKIKRYTDAGVAQNITIPTVEVVRKAAGGPIPNLPVVYDVLPSDTETIVMIPPMKGDIEKFVRIIQYLFKTEIFRKETSSDLRLRDKVAIVCMSPFFSIEENPDVEKNLLMFYLHLRLQSQNKNNFFVLNSISSFNPGVKFYEEITGLPGIATADAFPIANYLNPSYILFQKPLGKYKGIVITAEFGKILEKPRKNKNKGFKHPSQLLTSETFATIPSMPQDDVDTPFNDYLSIGCHPYKADLIKARTDVPVCKNLLTVFYDEDITSPYLISDKREEIHVFRYNTIREPPILCMDETGKLSKLAPPPGDFAPKENDPNFVKKSEKELKRVEVDAVVRKLRPDTPEVFDNWIKMIYSKEEADFLNSLQLSPTLLHFVFGDNWKLEVAHFLKKVVVSECFRDIQLLTKAECDSVRQFLDKVLDYFYTNAALKFDETPILKLTLPTYVEEEEEAPILEPDQLSSIPAIGTYAWPPEIIDVDPMHFTKDSFGSIDRQVNGTNYAVDFIAVQIKSGDHLFKRLLLDRVAVNDEANQKGVPVEVILKEKLDEQQSNFPDFIFIY